MGIAERQPLGLPPPHPHVHAEHGFAMTGRGNGVIPSEQNVL